MAVKILLTGIPGPRLFYAEAFSDFSIKYTNRRKDIRDLDDILAESKTCGNTGNLLIGEGAASALAEWDCTYLPFWYLRSVIKSPDRIAALREHFDLVVLATANMIKPGYSADAEAEVLSALEMRTVIIGVGIQDRNMLDAIPEGTLRLLRFLADGGHTALTRGAETADYLRSKGVTNATPTGCPSIYLKPQRMVEAIARLKEIGDLHFRACMIGGYLGHIKQSSTDIELLSRFSRRLCYVLQDEFLHYGLEFHPSGSRRRIYDPVNGRIDLGYHHKKMDAVRADISLHVFFDNDDWRQWASDHDLYFGRRFHGGVLAMQAGIPTVFIAVDDRMRELLRYVGLPYLDGRYFDAAPDKVLALRSFIDEIDADAVIARYRGREANFRQALTQAVAAAATFKDVAAA